MKRFISIFTCLVIILGVLVLPEPIEVHAEEVTTKEYYFEYLSSCVNSFGNNEYKGYYGNATFVFSQPIAMYLVSYDGECELNIILLNDDGSYNNINNSVKNMKYYSDSYSNASYIDGVYKYEGSNYDFSYISEQSSSDIEGYLEWNTSTIEESGFVKTNIPYFSSEEECKRYLLGELDIKNAINYETDVSNVKYDLEIPKNLKIKNVNNNGASGYFLISWEQTDEFYKNWNTEIYEYVDFQYRNSVLIFSWEDWKYVNDYYAGQSIIDTYKLNYKIGHMKYADDKDLNDRIRSEYPTEYGGVYEFGNHKVYMRNYYFDGQYRHYSNWVIIEINPEEGAWVNPDMDTTVVEKEGSELIVDDSGVPVQPDSNIIQDSEYTGIVNENFETVDGTDLISWIKNGFGLGGDNGVLAMMSDSFSFVPSEIWAVFAAGISIMVVVAIFKFIRG